MTAFYYRFLFVVIGLGISLSKQCINYDSSYTTINGTDSMVKANESITYVEMGNNATSIISQTQAEYIAAIWNCSNSDGCTYMCLAELSCLITRIRCNSIQGCNLICGADSSCDALELHSYPNTSLTIVCSAIRSCRNMQIDVTGSSRVEIHCMQENSCEGMEAYFTAISSKQNPNTSISCYSQNACNELYIDTDGPYTKLIMYEHSKVTYYNPIGYLSQLQTISCALNDKYIKYNLTDNTPKQLQNLVADEYSSALLPCLNVTVLCNENDTIINGSCSMKYKYHPQNLNNNDRFVGEQCVYVELTDIISMDCVGQCITSPTTAPTFTPTSNPSNAPSYSPSFSPTYSPSISPTNLPTIPPTSSPSRYPTIPPTYSPTYSPTLSPTVSPTRYPTSGSTDFDMKLEITYLFKYLNDKNYNFIANNSQNDAVQSIEAIIERNYFDSSFLPYSAYDVQIGRINDINLDKLTISNVKDENELYAQSVVYFNERYKLYVIGESQSRKWQNDAAKSFQKYLNNSYLNFSVLDWEDLEAVSLDPDQDASNVVFWVITFIVLSCIMIPILVSRCSRLIKMQICLPVDSKNWYSMLLVGLATYDVITNIILMNETFHHRYKGSIIRTCGYIIVILILLRIITNVCYAIFTLQKLISYNQFAENWWKRHKKKFLFWVVLTGGNTYPMLVVASSNIFGMKFTNSGITKLELKPLYLGNNKVLFRALLIECIPMMIIEIIYRTADDHISAIFLSTLISSSIFFILYIVCCLTNCNKNEANQKLLIFSYIEVKLKAQIAAMTSLKSKQKKHIKRRKGLRKELKKQYVALYPDIINMRKNFEISDTNLRRKGFVIRFVHRLNKLDLLRDDNDGYNVNAGIEELEFELKEYCLGLFTSKKEEIEQLIMNHYYDLDENKFEIKYHKEYPVEKYANVNARNLGTRSNDDDGEGETDENDDIDDEYIDEDGEDMNDEMIQDAIVNQHREQFKKAIQIVKQEKKTKQNDYNHLMFVLQANDINFTVIDDVLHFATKSGILESKHESDIDCSDSENDSNRDNIGFNRALAEINGEVDGEYPGEIQMQSVKTKSFYD